MELLPYLHHTYMMMWAMMKQCKQYNYRMWCVRVWCVLGHTSPQHDLRQICGPGKEGCV